RREELLARRRRELGKPGVSAVGAGQQLGLVVEAVVAHQRGEGRLVAPAVVAVDDLVVGCRDPAQAHDLAHRVDVLGTGLHAAETVRAVEDALRVLREVVEPLELAVVARVASSSGSTTSRRTRRASSTARTVSAAWRPVPRTSTRWARSCACAGSRHPTTRSSTATTAGATRRPSPRWCATTASTTRPS